jgi:geranylgeranyl diphosphate synthase, type I
MNIQEFKKFFDSELDKFLSNKIKEDKQNLKLTDTYIKLLYQAKKISLSGGKRLRPYLIYLSYFSFKKENTSHLKEILNLLIAMEIFHIFCLIHDDIIDQDENRHSEMTVHYFALKKLKFNKDTANSSAILIGDLYFSYILQLLNNYSEKIKNIFQIIIQEVVYGQFLDVKITEQKTSIQKEIEVKNYLKTAKYSFVRPIDLGIALNPSKNNLGSFSEKLGKELGITYQIQDDLISLITKTKDSGKTELSDIQNGNHTFFSDLVFKTKYKKDLMKFFKSKKIFSEKEKEEIRNIFKKSGAIEIGKNMIEKNISSAQKLIEKNNFQNQDKWLQLISLLENRIK